VSGTGALRVCFVAGNLYPLLANRTDLPAPGGAEVQQLAVATELARRGVEVSYVTEDYGQGPECVLGGSRVHAYAFGRNKLRQGVTLWRALDRAGADVYYVRGAPRFLALLLAHGRLARRPLVLGMSTNQMAHPRRAAGLSPAEHLAWRRALSGAFAVVAQTESQRALLLRNYGLRNAVVIPNGAPPVPAPDAPGTGSRSPGVPANATGVPANTPGVLENGSRAPTAIPDGEPRGDGGPRTRVVWIAAVLPYKGIERLFDLAGLCPALRFEVIGGAARGEEAYHDAMRARASGIANILWRGPVPHRDLDAALAGALALVNTTVPWRGVPDLEGFPNVYLEAWRNGVPTLTLDNDPDEVICRSGLGFHSPSLDRMALDLESLAGDPSRRAAMGEAAQAHVARAHDMGRVAQAYHELFLRAAGRA
jgi:glycosyltransferase involved in cell wall biosynthesis